MSIIRAYALPHPPLAVQGIGDESKTQIPETLAAFDAVACEIAELAPDTIIFITPHNVMYSDYIHISPGNVASGDFSRFNAGNVRIETKYDENLAKKIAGLSEQNGIRAGFLGEKNPTLDHGVMVPMWFINRHYSDYKTIRISQSGMDNGIHYRLGQVIAEAAKDTKTVLIASGDLSHKLSENGPYGFAEEGAEFDVLIQKVFSGGDFSVLFGISENLRECAAECGYNSFMVMAGCFDRQGVTAKLFSYEGPLGVGYGIASFIPKEHDSKRDFLEQYTKTIRAEMCKRQESEDEYQKLARCSLEHVVENGRILPLPSGLPNEMLENRAGAFVSLHKNGRLRGCIGTIAPTADNIALEIIQNAVSAGLNDHRFEPVELYELPYLSYKVDILSAPEPISDISELDVKRYGVIVSSGHKRGLLLPNLDGVDTVEQQVDIARQKGGISENEPIKLERFEVVRHE